MGWAVVPSCRPIRLSRKLLHMSLLRRDFISSAHSILAFSVTAVVRCTDTLRVLDVAGLVDGGKNEVICKPILGQI